MRRYGITLDQYDRMLEYQGHRCGACGRHVSESKTRLAVDHCHRTGLVRGLLCCHCNQWVIARHTVKRLEDAVNYLKHLPGVEALGEVIVPKQEKRRKRGRYNKA